MSAKAYLFGRGMFIYMFILLMLGFALACAESPRPIVKVSPQGDVGETENVVILRRTALYFHGRDALGKKCHIAATYATYEFAGQPHHNWLVQVDNVAPDGHRPRLGVARWFELDSASGQYHSLDGIDENERLGVLVSMSVSGDHADEEMDPNQLNERMHRGELKEFARLTFHPPSRGLGAFIELIKGVIERQSIRPDEKLALEQLQSLMMVLGHGDHYHTSTCSGFQLEGLRQVDFHLADHHDHDHEGESVP